MSVNAIKKQYRIIADTHKSTYQEEQWSNTLSNGKKIVLLKTVFFRYGQFIIELTDEEKNKILKQTSIILNNYNIELEELCNSYNREIIIQNQEQYTKNEIDEIDELFYDSDNNENDDDIMDENGWFLDETIYGFTCGCELTCLE